MDKILNSSFYLHLEEGEDIAKKYKSIDILESNINYNNKGKITKITSDGIEIGIMEIVKRWINKIFKVVLIQTKTQYYNPDYCYKGRKDTFTIKYNQIIMSLCGHVNDLKVQRVFREFSKEVFDYIDKNI